MIFYLSENKPIKINLFFILKSDFSASDEISWVKINKKTKG